MILALSSWEDEHFASVHAELMRRGREPTLLDLSGFPARLSLSIDYDGPGMDATFSGDHQQIDLSDCRVAWWRRPRPYTIPDDIADTTDMQFAYAECHHAVTGLWSAMDATWINDPAADDEASHKPYQLAVAKDAGMAIPRTLITSDPDAARAFANELGERSTIYKAFSGTEDAWRETRVLRSDELDLLDNVRFAPVIFQEYVQAVLDIRVTVIGNDVFASAIDTTGGEYPFDYRAELGSARIGAYTLPADVEGSCLSITRKLGLVYGAIDLRVTPEGNHIFLEINPSGQWLFMEERTGQPITSAFCDLLVDLDS